MPVPEFHPDRLLEVLVRHRVRFVVVGGAAANALGSPELTRDLDLCYDRSTGNLELLVEALRELRAELRGAEPGLPFTLDARTLELGDSFTFITDYGPLDVLGTPSGTRGFDELIRNARDEELFGHRVAICSLDDLIG